MQPIQWYIRRLRTMSLAEIIWRVNSEVRDSFDHVRFTLGFAPDFDNFLKKQHYIQHEPGFSVSDMPVGAWQDSGTSIDQQKWRDDLVSKAESLMQHKFSFFNHRDQFLGSPINWNYDHSAGKPTPMLFWKKVDYRDFRQSGDCKQVWEPNRHHHLVVLGRAYRATGDIRYAEEIMAQLESWLDQNPFGYGMNWRSPLELGVRIINWVWALDLIKDAGLMKGPLKHRLFNAIYLHCWENVRKFSQGSSANNHLIGEVAGVFVAASYFKELPNMQDWARQSQQILEEQLFAQTFSDGCTREHALGYEFFVIQFYLVCGLVGKWTNQNYSDAYWARLEKMFEFVALLDEGGEDLPMFGDRDNGYVLDLGSTPHNVSALLSIGALLFNRPDFKTYAPGYSEMAEWLLGTEGREAFTAIAAGKKDTR
ncbi:MAG: alginate lyase family protein, partial [Gammaproteobacteria bacterium]|nr:alginate lyase family protein [Gammaproteobacteria bacterium]